MTIEERIRAEHPSFKVRVGRIETIISPETDPDRYEAMLAERVAWTTEADTAAAVETADQQLRQQVRAALADLDDAAAALLGEGAVSPAIQRAILGRLCRVVATLIRVLIRRGVMGE